MPKSEDNKLGLMSLVFLIIGSMIGGGAFDLPANLANGASGGAIIIGWLITGVGMLALAFVYQLLSYRKSELTGGIYTYARDGFGQYIGFNSAWGYWVSAWLGNVSYMVMLFATLGYFFPIFGEGNNLASVIGASILIWLLNALILKGIKQAAFVNTLTTIARLIPVFLFILIGIFVFNFDKFNFDFWGHANYGSIMNQVKSTMLVTLWVFIGIEGAVVVSGRAKKISDVGKATIIGLVGTLLVYILISVMALGSMNSVDVGQLKTPSLAYLLENIVGKWGAIFINIGLIISLFGSLLGWSLLAAEIPFVAGKDKSLPKIFEKENEHGSPSGSLWVTNGLIQLCLIITLFSKSTYELLYSIASAAILIPYFLSALYAWKVTFTDSNYVKDPSGRGKEKFCAILATIYSVWLIYAAGLEYLLLCAIIYAIGIVVYYKARKENNEKLFENNVEAIIALIILVAAIIAVVLMATGKISV